MSAQIKAWLLSMDSLTNQKGEPEEGAAAFIDMLHMHHIPFAILTETSMYSRKELAEKMNRAGFHDILPEDFYPSVIAGIDLILSSHPEKNKADYLGEKGLVETMRQAGMILTQQNPDWLFISVDRQAEYSDYCRALDEVINGTIMVAMDETAGMKRDGRWRIGAGAVCAMMEQASGKKALHASEIDFALFERALSYLQADAGKTAFVTSDYRRGLHGAKKMKITTILIMHNAPHDDLLEKPTEYQPDYVVESYTGFMK